MEVVNVNQIQKYILMEKFNKKLIVDMMDVEISLEHVRMEIITEDIHV